MGTIAKVSAGGSTHLIASTCYATCTTAKATAAKVATVIDSQAFTLMEGVTVHVKFTYSNTASSPTLNVSGSGAKAIMRYGTTAVSTAAASSWRDGAVVAFTYDGTNWVENTGIDDNSNTYDRIYLNSSAIKCGSTAIVAANICTANSNGLYQHLKSGNAFDITMPIVYANSAIAANAVSSGAYIIIPFTVTTTQSITLTAFKPVYIKGTVNGKMFTPISTTPLTQTEPTSDDGYQYMLLGHAYSTTAMYLTPDHTIYEYVNGKFTLYESTRVRYGTAAPNNSVGKDGDVYIRIIS